MTEYWKSTPKYWCKFCKVYVRDTKFERTQHEATQRHQGSIQKSIRDIHRTKEREERDTQRAKQEVARLKGAFGAPSAAAPSAPAPSITRRAPPPSNKQATVEDRKRQMQQLAAMGIDIPDDYRAEMGMPGAWQAVSERPAGDGGDKEVDVKPSDRSASDKKRKHKDDEEEEQDGSVYVQRKGWGSRMKSYPKSGQAEDLDALLGAPIQLKSEVVAAKKEDNEVPLSTEDDEASRGFKEEDQDQPSQTMAEDRVEDKPLTPKLEEADDTVPSGVIFKKRKSKLTKDKIQSAVDSK